jgi:hypothetical protein
MFLLGYHSKEKSARHKKLIEINANKVAEDISYPSNPLII